MSRYRSAPRKTGPRNNGAIKIEIDGRVFHSKVEGFRYLELKDRQKRGLISDLECQPRYKIIHPLKVHEPKLKDKLVCTYIGDFRYLRNGVEVTEDVKGAAGSDIFNLKKKMVRMFLDIHIVEVRRRGRMSPNGKYQWECDGIAEK